MDRYPRLVSVNLKTSVLKIGLRLFLASYFSFPYLSSFLSKSLYKTVTPSCVWHLFWMLIFMSKIVDQEQINTACIYRTLYLYFLFL